MLLFVCFGEKMLSILRVFLMFFLSFLVLIPVNADRGLSVSIKDDVYSQKTALIIGNSAYKSSPLKNPRNDAEDMAVLLRKLNFQVTIKSDIGRIQMRKVIRTFGESLKKGGVGLFFFAGHGMQVNGKNYLIPVDADIQAEDEVQDYAVDAGMVLRKMQSAGNPLNLVFLDACRDNPFARSFRSGKKGLAQMDAPKGSLIVYATAPGSVAADGNGRNGIFTKNLMNHMERPNLEIGMMLRDVRIDVLKDTNDKQIPWDSSSLVGKFFFLRGSNPVAQETNQTPELKTINEEETLWRATENSKYAEDYQFYLKKYPLGRFAATAELKIRQLTRQQKKIKEVADGSFQSEKIGSGYLTINSDPLNARIYINNSFKGYSPKSLSIEPGDYIIQARKGGYKTTNKTIQIISGLDKDITLFLDKIGGSLLINSQPQVVDIYLNGIFKGQSSNILTGIDEGNYKVVLKKKGYKNREKYIYVSNDKETIVNLTLEKIQKNISNTGKVEVLHWWTSGGEAAALNVLKEDLQGKGIGWKNMPVAGGGGTQAMTVLRSRVKSGTAPTAVQMLGFDILDWAEHGVLANLNSVAEEENWDSFIPEAVQKFSKYNGQWMAVPVNVHSTNWVWANKEIFRKVGVSIPTTWDEFITISKKIKRAGYIPIAHGGQAWQDATVFDSVLLSVEGYDFYKKTMVDLDLDALGSGKMIKAFDRMREFRRLLDPNFSGRAWNLATSMVINEKAAMQIMGDWAKGEFIKAGKVPEKDFLCFRFPETQGIVTFNSDQFAMFKVGSADTNSQMEMAKSVISPAFQFAFNTVKGSAPARMYISDEDFDACAKKGIVDLAAANYNGTLIGSMAHGHANPAAIKNAMYDVITNHFNTNQSSRNAVKALVAAVKNAM